MNYTRSHSPRLLSAVLALLTLTHCNEKQKETPQPRAKESTSASATAPAAPTPEQDLTLEPGQRLVLFCAADLLDPIQATQWDILSTTIPSLGGGLIAKYLDAASDPATQLQHLQLAQKVKPAILLIQPVETKLASAILSQLRTAGTVILGLDSALDPQSCDQVAFVDQHKLGLMAGNEALAALRRKAAATNQATVTGRIVLLTTDDTSKPAEEERSGIQEALKAESGVIIVHDAPGLWSAEGAKERIKEALRLQGTFDVVIAQNDLLSLGASDALTEAEKRDQTLIISIGGLHGEGGGIPLLRKGRIDSVIRHPLPMEKLYPTLQTLADNPGHKPQPLREELPGEVLNQKNLEDTLRRQDQSKP